MDEFFHTISFPYKNLRKGQEVFIKMVYDAVETGENLLISAPTGSGKTISAIAPALYLAKKMKKTLVCLTSRQTQANQVISTISDIRKKSNEKIKYVAFIGKRSMCVHEERDLYPASDFLDFCRKTREKGKCLYFKNSRNEEFQEEIAKVLEVSSEKSMSVEEFVNFAGNSRPQNSRCGFCPYELAALKANNADIVVCDYNYLFSYGMLENFLGKIGKELSECIIIVDEAHNLPDRIRNAYTFSLSTELLKNALRELEEVLKNSAYDDYIISLRQTLEDIYLKELSGDKTERIILRDEFISEYLKKLPKINFLGEIIGKLREIELLVKEDRIISYVGRIANFLERWEEMDEENYLRLISKEDEGKKTSVELKIRCIDPNPIAREILNGSHSSILMSATLSPINMYKDILGISNAKTLELESPFEKENQLTLVIDDVTSRYQSRGFEMYSSIASHIKNILIEADDRNGIIFFPSYGFMDQVVSKLNIPLLNRKVFREQKSMTKEDKEKIISEFKARDLNTRSSLLFAVTSGSFSEGLDLPEDALELVIVVGLPLSVPDTYTNALIAHYEKKYRKGELYGYVYPAMSKIIQAAGRCIRTENDKGIVILMDARYLWPKYALSFPKHWNLKSKENYAIEIESFFSENDPMNF